MATIIRKNERSWAIDLIAKINEIANANDLIIKKAGGENTISTSTNTMFPDVILYGDKEQTVFLQGWELKMPDVPIEDETNIKDAQRKAIALDLNSCLIWNFTYAVLFLRNNDDTFSVVKQWNDTSFIRTREDVRTYRTQWEVLLQKIILEVNEYFALGTFRKSNIGDIISNTAIVTLVQRNKAIVAEKIKTTSYTNSRIGAFIDNWWSNIRSEYEHDETDKYAAYAKSIILNWTNRIIFAHIIKHKQNYALCINNLSSTTTPAEANKMFEDITKHSDFYNVFAPVEYNEILPDLTWQDLTEFSLFLTDNGIEALDQKVLQSILEGSVNSAKRVINGQFTTPYELAKILTKLSVSDWSENILDCCCGTGTIPKAVIENKIEKFGIKESIETVWACDKYAYPLQIANISMTSPDTINLANRLFQHDALTLSPGDAIIITDPTNGDKMTLSVPEMGTIVSNLPFVEFEKIPEDDMQAVQELIRAYNLDQRSDLYCYIALRAADILKPDGTLGVITSNSWLGTAAGNQFVQALKHRYSFEQIHISGKGRWFKNADVVTTIIVLRKKNNQASKPINFFLWKRSLDQLAENEDIESKLINSALLGEELDPSVVMLSSYTSTQISDLLDYQLSYNALFHNVNWIHAFKEKIRPINEVFDVFRGSRRGWDALFYPRSGEHHIEKEYLQKVLINARNVDYLLTEPDREAFCCSDSIVELNRNNKRGALDWINKFINQKNGVGKSLPTVLSRSNMEWYELQVNEIAEIFTMMNPEQRLFFAKFKGAPAFVNQRLIGLRHKTGFEDIELTHALLNSVFTMFCIEASGFGRGLGVLDINKDRIAQCYMFNPELLTKQQRDDIVKAFEPLTKRKILRVQDEILSPDRIHFEDIVFSAFGLSGEQENVQRSLISMQQTRGAVRE